MIMHKFWKRFSEKNDVGDNPEIEEYVGRTELGIAYAYKKEDVGVVYSEQSEFQRE